MTEPPPSEHEVLRMEIRALTAETRAGFAEIRLAQAETNRRLDLVIDALAGLRADFDQHDHG